MIDFYKVEKNFNYIKDLLSDKLVKEQVDGFWFSEQAVKIIF